jgi:peptide-methionine (S)-S-oxide reductase
MKTEIAVFGGGCFWCTEAVFKMLKGVKNVEPGYAGGTAEDARYERVAYGLTDHVEVTKVEYDPTQIKFTDLLTVFFGSHDPTTVNRQGNDVGPQYRSVIFYTTQVQRDESEKFITELNASNKMGEPIVTTVESLDKFYPAEGDQKDYYENHKYQAYCQIIINPKLEKVQEKYADLLKKNDQS